MRGINRYETAARLPDTVAVIGVIPAADFENATASFDEFRDYCSYSDYIASRESLHLGLSTSGLVATALYMSLSTLTLWRKFMRKRECDGRPVAHDLWIGAIADLTIDG
jgi:hypothetical protein